MSLIPHDRIQFPFVSRFSRPNVAVLSGAIATLFTPLTTLPALAQTQFSSGPSAHPRLVVEASMLSSPELPEEQTAPRGRRDGGASRGNCLDYEDLTALVPLTEDNIVLSYTTATHPSFWFYIPAPIHVDTPLEFILQDADDNALDYTILEHQGDAGIYNYTLSEAAPGLSLDTPYYWTLAIYCDPDHPASFVYVQGTIERVDGERLSLEPLSDETERSVFQAETYAISGVLQDAITIAAELRQAKPNDPSVETLWDELLWQLDLGALAPAPMQDCCSD